MLKLLIREQESPSALSLWNSAGSAATSHLTYVEARSGLARAVAARRLRIALLGRAKAKLERLLTQVRLVEPTPLLLRAAGELTERHRLRAYDAVHLASALSLGDDDLVLASWDAELRRSAREAGLAVAPRSGVESS